MEIPSDPRDVICGEPLHLLFLDQTRNKIYLKNIIIHI